MTKMTSNSQNKICSFNILINDAVINKTPILFRIFESNETTLEDIIANHKEPILNKIYNDCDNLSDLLNIKLSMIIYDIENTDDTYETLEIDFDKYINYNDNRLEKYFVKQINDYASLLLLKIGINDKLNDFVEIYEKINNINDNKISNESFIQYILSCFNKEYHNKFNDIVINIMKNRFGYE